MATDPSPASPSPTFGALLQRYRLATGLSQENLAERAGVSARAISDLERGERQSPYPHTVRQLAQALRLSAADRDRLMAAVPARRGPRPLAPAETPPTTNLPEPLTSFVGRARELADVRQLLGRTRLMTLTGPGGVGKTRLALEAARAVAADYPDGVWLVELAALADGALAPQAAAQALGVRELPGQPILTTLLAALKPRRLLLVLDNCEHLLDGCAALVDALLRACPGLRVLAVSREPLALAGEVAWPTPPLALPDPDHPPTIDDLVGNDAVRLFVERAAAARPSFALTPENAAAVARLCARLDGIPLALELAAARVRGLPPEELAARLDDRFRLLTGGSRAAPPRQQTLRATVDWSYYLLTDPERGLLRRLAVFAGGWTIAAAEAVGAGDGLAADEALSVLLRLVDKSLVVAEERQGEPRYRVLETVRQYAWERLREAGEEASVRDRHAAWCLALAERAEPALRGPEQFAWFDRLEAEHDNLRAALAWSLAADAPPGSAGAGVAAGLRLAGALWWFWYLGHRREGAGWLERLLAHGRGALAAARAGAVFAHGCLRFDLDGAEGAAQGRALLAESVALYRGLDDRRGLAQALSWLGRAVHLADADAAGGGACADEATALARALGDRWLIADALLRGGCSADLTRPDELARAEAAEESLALFQAAGDALKVAFTQLHLGWLALHRADFDRARAAYEAALAPMRAVGDTGAVLIALYDLGEIARRQGDPRRAAASFREGVALLAGDDAGPWHLACNLDGLAAVAAAQGQSGRAARLLGIADGVWRTTFGRELERQRAFEATAGAAAAALGEAAFAAAWAEGQAMVAAEAIAYALAEEPEPALSAAPEQAPDREQPEAGDDCA